MQPQAQQEEQALSKDEQKSLNDAFAAAHESHAAIYREAKSASAAEKDASSNAWMLAAGRHAEPLLFKLGLVDAQYLLALADAGAMSVPRWHEVPPQAALILMTRGSFGASIMSLPASPYFLLPSRSAMTSQSSAARR